MLLVLLRSALVAVAARHSVQSVRIVTRLPINQGEPALLTTACKRGGGRGSKLLLAVSCKCWQTVFCCLKAMASERVSRSDEKQCRMQRCTRAPCAL